METCGFDGSVLCCRGRIAVKVLAIFLSSALFFGYSFLERITRFIMVNYAFFNCFAEELVFKIFEHSLNKALNNRMVDPGGSCIDGTHIKANANKKKIQKEQVAKAAKNSGQLRKEINAECEDWATNQ